MAVAPTTEQLQRFLAASGLIPVTPPDPHAPFLRSIIDRPEDDLPRLIYADYLDERGDPRGEFIRVQCELATPGHAGHWCGSETHWCALRRCPGCASNVFPRSGAHFEGEWRCARCSLSFERGELASCRWHALRRRERELLEENRGWLDPKTVPFVHDGGRVTAGRHGTVYGPPVEYVYRRGFVEGVMMEAGQVLKDLDPLFAAAPVTLIRLAEGPTVERPAGCGVAEFKAAAGAVAQAAVHGGLVPLLYECVQLEEDRHMPLLAVQRNVWRGRAKDIPAECRAWPRVTPAWAGNYEWQNPAWRGGFTQRDHGVYGSTLPAPTPPPATP